MDSFGRRVQRDRARTGARMGRGVRFYDFEWKSSLKSSRHKRNVVNACGEVLLVSDEVLYLYERVRDIGGGNIANIGCFLGGSATAMALALKESKLEGRVYTVDLYGTKKQRGTSAPKGSDSVAKGKWRVAGVSDFIQQNIACTYEFAKAVGDLEFDFVFIDGDHTRKGALLDIKAWALLVKVGGIMAIHDTHVDPLQSLVEELIEKHLEGKWVEDVPCRSIRSFRRTE